MENLNRKYFIIVFILFLPTTWLMAEIIESSFFTSKRFASYQQHLQKRFSLYPAERKLGFELMYIATLNEDFDTALRVNQELREKATKTEKVQLDLAEIRILSFKHQPARAAQKAKAFIAKNPKATAAKTLQRRLPILEASARLKLYQGQRFRKIVNLPQLQFSSGYALMAKDFLFLRSKGNNVLFDLKSRGAIAAENLGISDKFYKWRDFSLLHRLPGGKQSAYLYHDGDNTYLVTKNKQELSFLAKNQCGFGTISPWLDFVIASCFNEQKKNYDLVLFRRQNGTFEKESKALEEINTNFHEKMPRLSRDGRFLTFSSNGHPGFGGYDMYISTISYHEGRPHFNQAVNVFTSINSFHNEEQALQFGNDSLYFARELGGKVRIDAYLKTDTLKEKSTVSFQIQVLNQQKKPLAFKATLFSSENDEREKLDLSNQGSSDWVYLISTAKYQLKVSSPGYFYHFDEFMAGPAEQTLLQKKVILKPIEKGATIIAGGILYARRSAELTPGAQREVDAIFQLLQNNPNMKIFIEGHTDSVGSEAKNQALSDLRAQSVLQALLKRGVKKERMQAKGFGETKPLVSNATIAGRTKNRRTEVRITEFKK